MNTQNQWLFETPITTPAPSFNLEYYSNLEGETESELPEINSHVLAEQEWEALSRTRVPNHRTPEGRKKTVTPAACTAIGHPEVLDHFAYDKDLLSPLHQKQIQKIVQCVLASYSTAQPIRSLRLVGHTDPTGADAYNLQLGQRRANQVRKRLQQEIEARQPGLSTHITFTVETRGEKEPVSNDAAKNRRVEIFLPVAIPPKAVCMADLNTAIAALGLKLSDGELRTLQSGKKVTLLGKKAEELKRVSMLATAITNVQQQKHPLGGVQRRGASPRQICPSGCKGICLALRNCCLCLELSIVPPKALLQLCCSLPKPIS